MSLTSKNVINFDFWLYLAFFGLDDVGDFHWLHWVSASYSKINPSHHSLWLREASLVQFKDSRWCPDTPACGTLSDHHSAVLAPFLRWLSARPSLRWWYSKHLFFHDQLTCDHSNSQPTIATNYLHYSLNVDFRPACWRPPAPGVIFHLLTLLFGILMPLKNIYARPDVISIYLVKYFKFLLRSFPNWTKYFRFIRCSALIALPSVLTAERSEKEQVCIKVFEKKSYGCRKLRLQLYNPKIITVRLSLFCS